MSRGFGALQETPPPVVASNDDDGWRVRRLIKAIDTQVIPRIALGHKLDHAVAPACTVPVGDVEELSQLVIVRDAEAAAAYADSLYQRGASAEALCLNLLAPTARRLGDLWLTDELDFSTVTIGVGRLQQVLHGLHWSAAAEPAETAAARSALLMPMPGEDHTFGLLMVAEFFRHAGWNVRGRLIQTQREAVNLVRHEWFGLIGISVSSEQTLGALAEEIRAIRRASLNRGVGILVGGPIFGERPELVRIVGADATADDGRAAVLQGEQMLALLSDET